MTRCWSCGQEGEVYIVKAIVGGVEMETHVCFDCDTFADRATWEKVARLADERDRLRADRLAIAEAVREACANRIRALRESGGCERVHTNDAETLIRSLPIDDLIRGEE